MKSSSSNPTPLAPTTVPIILVLSGPSGAGKDAALSAIKARGLPITFVVTNTTRPMRRDELDNVHYHFVTQQEFTRLIDQGELLEHAEVYGHFYGVPKAPVRIALANGQDIIIKVDVQGAMTIKRNLPDAVLVFLMPPSIEELARRLNGRNSESVKELETRLDTARSEIEKLSLFDYMVMSYRNGIEQTVADIEAIMRAEKLRVPPRQYSI